MAEYTSASILIIRSDGLFVNRYGREGEKHRRRGDERVCRKLFKLLTFCYLDMLFKLLHASLNNFMEYSLHF